MRWPFKRSNQALAGKLKAGGLRTYLETPAQKRNTAIAEAALLAIDFETTGLSPEQDKIISVGMVDVAGLRIPLGSATNFLVIPDQGVGQSAVIHTLTDDELAATGISEREALDEVFRRLAGKVLLAHHTRIEVGFLQSAVHRHYGIQIAIDAVDTMVLGHRALGVDEDHARDALRLWKLRHRAGLPSYPGHDAVIDALGCAELYLALAQELGLPTIGAAIKGW